MFQRRALPGTLAGGLGLGFAVAAIITGRVLFLVLAAVATAASVALVLTGPDRLPVRYKQRKDLADEAERLSLENDRMAARAARFEAEAIAARELLATAMLAERSRTSSVTPDDPVDRGQPAPSVLPAAPPAPAEPDRSAAVDPAEYITDPETGVFTQVFFDASLGKRLSAARRGLRPLTVALLEVIEHVGEPPADLTEPRPVADILVATLREADTVAHRDDGLFAVLLEDTPENGAIWTLERIRRRISEDLPGRTMRAGLSCYPAYAFDADQIVEQAHGALDAAREWRQDRIEVTTATPDE